MGTVVVFFVVLIFLLLGIFICIYAWVAPKSTFKDFWIWGSVACAALSLIIGLPLDLAHSGKNRNRRY